MDIHEAEETFHILRFSVGDLENMEEAEAAFLSLTTFLVGEINTFARMYLCSAHDFEGDYLVDWAAISQRAVLMRVWSAKLYEFFDLLKSEDKPGKDRPSWLKSCIARGNDEALQLRQGRGWEIVSALRNDVTYHLNEKPARKNLKHITPGADLNFYVNERNSNSIFMLGEEVMFNGRLNRHSNRDVTLEERSNSLREWSEWNSQATKLAVKFQWELVKKLVLPLQAPLPLATKVVTMGAEKIGDATAVKVPLFDRC